jgi:hypothetical protein
MTAPIREHRRRSYLLPSMIYVARPELVAVRIRKVKRSPYEALKFTFVAPSSRQAGVSSAGLLCPLDGRPRFAPLRSSDVPDVRAPGRYANPLAPSHLPSPAFAASLDPLGTTPGQTCSPPPRWTHCPMILRRLQAGRQARRSALRRQYNPERSRRSLSGRSHGTYLHSFRRQLPAPWRAVAPRASSALILGSPLCRFSGPIDRYRSAAAPTPSPSRRSQQRARSDRVSAHPIGSIALLGRRAA